ncbi:type II secretion system protein N [Maricaulis salignorans]|uniref:Type II secretion system protein N n=1 Tax=Maricaulis salignorans TaxID=144026 RepID=A0A1G9LUQ5_9PROT|nr:type II secretion system protein N [Maricaulis salignorans]SDL65467.1 Type II secretion system (T2SS), protein N [Maricaulis salignorans]
MLRLLAVFIIALLIGLIATLPLKLVLGLTTNGVDLSRAEIHGSIWNGTIRGARLGQVSMRRAQIHTRPWTLPGGRPAIDWVLADAGLRGSGLARVDLHGNWQVLDAQLVGVPVRMGLQEIPGLTEAAVITVSLDRLDFTGGHCAAASGVMTAAFSADLSQEFGLAVPELNGALECRGGELVAALSGETADMTVAADMIFGSAAVAWTIDIATTNADLGNALSYSGFQLSDGIWRQNGEMGHAD